MNSIDDLMQDCSISIANALEILQSCTKPLVISMGEDSESLTLLSIWLLIMRKVHPCQGTLTHQPMEKVTIISNC